MGVSWHVPEYPVSDSAPGFWKCVGNFSFNDVSLAVGTTLVSLPFGFFSSPSVAARPMLTWTAGGVGALGGFLLAYQQSNGRLRGIFPPNK